MKPNISIITATLNSGNILDDCLKSVRSQKYDQDKIEILICDGGSTDNTLQIAKKYNCRILNNPLKTAESGKAIGVKQAQGKYLIIIDSDNILPTTNWLHLMLKPFRNNRVIGSEPWEYTYRKGGGFIERYSALTGVNDPYALVANIYDRKSILNSNWNGMNILVNNHQYYQTFNLSQPLPSIGANGTMYRTKIIQINLNSPFYMDVDMPSQIAKNIEGALFAKVKCGIVHTYCESSISKFIKKQNRRVVDLYIYQSDRPKNYIQTQLPSIIKYVLYVTLIIPMFIDTVNGFLKRPDFAWFFHPLACLITLFLYAKSTISYKLGILKPQSRSQWQQ
jgi:glycosyltransferase involved in cell wall biosynthesis